MGTFETGRIQRGLVDMGGVEGAEDELEEARAAGLNQGGDLVVRRKWRKGEQPVWTRGVTS